MELRYQLLGEICFSPGAKASQELKRKSIACTCKKGSIMRQIINLCHSGHYSLNCFLVSGFWVWVLVLVQPCTWGLPPRFLSYHIISVHIQSEGQPEALFSQHCSRAPILWFWCCTQTVQSVGGPGTRPGKAAAVTRGFCSVVLALACLGCAIIWEGYGLV